MEREGGMEREEEREREGGLEEVGNLGMLSEVIYHHNYVITMASWDLV